MAQGCAGPHTGHFAEAPSASADGSSGTPKDLTYYIPILRARSLKVDREIPSSRAAPR